VKATNHLSRFAGQTAVDLPLTVSLRKTVAGYSCFCAAKAMNLVEAAGQLIHTFRYGLDYSFTCILAGESVL